MAQLFGCFLDISDIFFYVIIGWVKREGSPSFMQMFDIMALGREIPAKVFCKLFPITMKSISVQAMVPFSYQMVQSVFKFVNILIFSEVHSFHPVFCSIYVSVRPFSWESFKDGRRNLHSGCIIIIRVCIWIKVRVWKDTPMCTPMQGLLISSPGTRVGLQAGITECIHKIS